MKPAPVRIWREVEDHTTGRVTIEHPVELSPISVMMNRLYKPEDPLTREEIWRVVRSEVQAPSYQAQTQRRRT